ncbi:hypothetical protein [Sphingobacterium deserti]|uniref:Uncharacterized protein n=1 Tax=Sphingobacterium deserti TaxID=1229276 RepID=A0A0B8T5X7_9SPHI|nr:hypothetical protein [Sphingobacterium deserti]KGE16188.1 hypothetical protein DI53_0021 [Sphingobacterium deserti]
MKTSSKLLIILAIAIFVLPLSILSYTVSRGRVGLDEYSNTFHEEATQSDKEDRYLKTTALPAFQKVKVLGHAPKPGNINIVFVKSDKYAIKIDKNSASHFSATVNENRELVITGEEPYFYHNTVYIFAPSAQELTLKNVGAKIEANTEHLAILGDSITELRFAPESSIGELIVELKNSTVSMSNPQRDVASPDAQAGNAKLDVFNSNVRIEHPNFDNMQIKAERSKIIFDKGSSGNLINSLYLHTLGQNSITLDSVGVGSIKGALSEETTIDLPIQQLRKLINNQ